MNSLAQAIPIFLINLDRSTDRLMRIRSQLNALELPFERIAGIDGTKGLPDWARDQFMDGAAIRAGLSAGEVGCYTSHLVIFSKMAERKLDTAIVLEDDAVLSDDFEQITREVLGAVPEGWDCIHLSTDFKRPPFPIAPLGSDRHLVRYLRQPNNSAAYIVSRAGAAKLLAPRPRVRPFDMEFRYAWVNSLEIFGVYPAQAQQQPSFPTTILADWNTTRPQTGRLLGRKSAVQTRWKPSLASQIYGLFYVLARLSFAGVGYWLTEGLRGRRTAQATVGDGPPPSREAGAGLQAGNSS